jgi:pimeloyl-ACP methyl ester carboxylesterase
MVTKFQLAVRELGRGTCIVLLNGIGTPASHLYKLAEALSSELRVLVPTFPGDGDTPVYPGAYTMEIDLALLTAALAEHGVERAHLVGFSAGVYRALALHTSGAVRVQSLVSLAGFAGLPAEARQSLRQFADAVRARVLPDTVAVTQFLSPHFAERHPALVAEVRGWLAAQRPEGLAQQLYAAADAEDLTPRLAEITVPLCARSGELDVAVPYQLNQRLAAAVGGSFELVANAGHALVLEDFAGTLASIRTMVATER